MSLDFDRHQPQTQGAPWAGPASLVCGILASGLEITVCFPVAGMLAPFLVFVIAVLAIGFGALALQHARDRTDSRVLGATGLVLGLINLFASIALMLVTTGFVALIIGIRLLD